MYAGYREQNVADYSCGDIIKSWSAYERMFRNISWDMHITIDGAHDINSMSHPRHHSLVNVIYENTNNTPSRVRNKRGIN